jgi:SAM-dependent methyltransferase
MRVVDLDRDMRDVIPTGATRDSRFLFARMTEATLALARPGPGRRVLDVASGFGQDAVALAADGCFVVGAEPSARMAAWARLHTPAAPELRPHWVRAWGDELPFATGSFDAVICKGALDHFDRPAQAIAEMARVTAADGRVVLAVANFESLACRVARWRDGLRESGLGAPPPRGRRHYDVPADHFTRFDLSLVRDEAARHLRIERVTGLSLGWGLRELTLASERLPGPAADVLLRGLDAAARRLPGLADVILVTGQPRHRRPSQPAAERLSSSTSA